MSWKKNVDKPLFTYDDKCRREFYRVRPLPGQPVRLDFGGNPSEIVDISAGGLACHCQNAGIGEIRTVSFNLPDQKITYSARLRILNITPPSLCHCQFIDPPRDMVEAIHQYVLLVQKEELQRQKAAPSDEGWEEDYY